MEMKLKSLFLITIFTLSCVAFFAPRARASSFSYTFMGMYDEANTGGLYTHTPVTVSVHMTSGWYPSFVVNGSYTFTSSYVPVYFSYDLGHGVQRQYWLSVNETSGTFYIYNCSTGLSQTAIQIVYLGGTAVGNLLNVKFQNIAGVWDTVEKRQVDNTGTVVIEVKPNSVYSMTLMDGAQYTFGNGNTYSNQITLKVSPLNFPSSIIDKYRYVQFYAYRSSSVPADIIVNYNDVSLKTALVTYTITDPYGTVVHQFSYLITNSFSDVWTASNVNLTYSVVARIVQTGIGETSFSQTVPSVKAAANNGFIPLGWMGNWAGLHIDSTVIIPDLIIIFVYACFSVLNAYVGAFFAICVAAVEVWQGWLSITPAVLVVAFALMAMAALAYFKRRTG